MTFTGYLQRAGYQETYDIKQEDATQITWKHIFHLIPGSFLSTRRFLSLLWIFFYHFSLFPEQKSVNNNSVFLHYVESQTLLWHYPFLLFSLSFSISFAVDTHLVVVAWLRNGKFGWVWVTGWIKNLVCTHLLSVHV